MKSSMSQRSYLGWQRYWDAEPWGPWRDNVHAAIVAREVRRMIARDRAAPKLEAFMLRDPTERAVEAGERVWSALSAMSTKVAPTEAGAKMREARERGARSRRRSN